MTIDTDRARARLKVPLIIWMAFLMSLVVYAVVAYAAGDVIREGVDASKVPVKLLRLVFVAVAIAELAVSYFLRKVLPGGWMAQSKLIDWKKASADEAHRLKVAFGQYMTAVIISLAICESIAVYGFVLFMFGASYNTLLTFLFISALGMVFHCPRASELEGVAEKLLKE